MNKRGIPFLQTEVTAGETGLGHIKRRIDRCFGSRHGCRIAAGGCASAARCNWSQLHLLFAAFFRDLVFFLADDS